MNFKSKLALAPVAMIAGIIMPAHLIASTCTGMEEVCSTYTGTLSAETGADSVVLESFTVSMPSEVTLYTTSYGGGMNLDGSSTGPGGFQPNITLYDNTGFPIANQSPSFSPIANPDPSNGWKGDGYLQDSDVDPGTYYITLTDWQNQMSVNSTGLDLGTAAYLQFTGPGGTSFQDVQGNDRDGAYALNVDVTSLTPSSSTPEPATLWLMLSGVAAALVVVQRRKLFSSYRSQQ